MNLSTNDRTGGGTYIENGSGGKFFFAVFGFRFYKTTQFMGMTLEGYSFSVDDVETVTAWIGEQITNLDISAGKKSYISLAGRLFPVNHSLNGSDRTIAPGNGIHRTA